MFKRDFLLPSPHCLFPCSEFMICSVRFDPVRNFASNKTCAEELDVFEIWQKHLDSLLLWLSGVSCLQYFQSSAEMRYRINCMNAEVCKVKECFDQTIQPFKQSFN